VGEIRPHGAEDKADDVCKGPREGTRDGSKEHTTEDDGKGSETNPYAFNATDGDAEAGESGEHHAHGDEDTREGKVANFLAHWATPPGANFSVLYRTLRGPASNGVSCCPGVLLGLR